VREGTGTGKIREQLNMWCLRSEEE
jgi:hypothetical protein